MSSTDQGAPATRPRMSDGTKPKSTLKRKLLIGCAALGIAGSSVAGLPRFEQAYLGQSSHPAAVAKATPPPAAPAPAPAPPRYPVGDKLDPSDAEGATPENPSNIAAVTIYMGVPDSAALMQRVQQVSDPTSENYRRFLTPEQFQQEFGVPDANAAAVEQWAASFGLQVVAKSSTNAYLKIQGSIANLEAAFQTKFYVISFPDANGVNHDIQFNVPQASMPIGFQNQVLTVGGLINQIDVAQLHGQHVNSVPASKLSATEITKLLHNTAHTNTIYDTPGTTPGAAPAPVYVNAPPCSTYWGEKTATNLPPVFGNEPTPYVPCGYGPAQLEGAYGADKLIAKGIDGRGQTVAIVDAYASPTLRSDANRYATEHGQRAFSDTQLTEQLMDPNLRNAPPGGPCDTQGWYGEETLDVEAVHAMAPGANVRYMGALSCSDDDLHAAIQSVVDNRSADVISNSWGETGEPSDPGIIAAYEQTFAQAAVEGISVNFSSGDNGNEQLNSQLPTADYPASDPLVTAVGGTSLGIGKDNNYLFETGWGTRRIDLTGRQWNYPGAWLYGAGGGDSFVFAQPWYQQGVVPAALADNQLSDGSAVRTVPDIAADADPSTGFAMGISGTWPDGHIAYHEERIGGTSLASPLMAGMEALDNQAKGDHGFLNPAIYRLGGKDALHDIKPADRIYADVRVDYVNGTDATDGTRTTVRVFDQTAPDGFDGGQFPEAILNTRPGYDNVTGMGTPNVPCYVNLLGQ